MDHADHEVTELRIVGGHRARRSVGRHADVEVRSVVEQRQRRKLAAFARNGPLAGAGVPRGRTGRRRTKAELAVCRAALGLRSDTLARGAATLGAVCARFGAERLADACVVDTRRDVVAGATADVVVDALHRRALALGADGQAIAVVVALARTGDALASVADLAVGAIFRALAGAVLGHTGALVADLALGAILGGGAGSIADAFPTVARKALVACRLAVVSTGRPAVGLVVPAAGDQPDEGDSGQRREEAAATQPEQGAEQEQYAPPRCRVPDGGATGRRLPGGVQPGVARSGVYAEVALLDRAVSVCVGRFHLDLDGLAGSARQVDRGLAIESDGPRTAVDTMPEHHHVGVVVGGDAHDRVVAFERHGRRGVVDVHRGPRDDRAGGLVLAGAPDLHLDRVFAGQGECRVADREHVTGPPERPQGAVDPIAVFERAGRERLHFEPHRGNEQFDVELADSGVEAVEHGGHPLG